MLQALIIQRLKSQLTRVNIQAAASLAAVQAAAPMLPAIFVVITGEQGGAARYLSGAVAQNRSLSFTLIAAVKNQRDAQGEAASIDMLALRKKIDSALFGWSPDAAVYSPIIFNNGNTAGFIDQELWWQDHYSTEFDRR